MALVFADSFDDRTIERVGDRYHASSLNASNGSAIGPGRTGNGLYLSTGVLDVFDYLDFDFDNVQSVYVGVARGAGSLTTALCSIRNGALPHIYAQLNSDRTISVIRFDSGSPVTILATSTQTVPTSGSYYVELYGKIDPLVGAYELRIDGTRWLSATAVNTSSDGTSVANRVRFTYNHTGIDGATNMIDDVYIANEDSQGGTALITGFAGPVHIRCLNEIGNGGRIEWTPAAATNASMVGELGGQDGDGTYNQTASDQQRDAFDLSDLEVPQLTIMGVAVSQFAKKSDPLYRGIQAMARVNATEYFGDKKSLTGSYAMKFYAFERNPNTEAIWTLSEVNRLQIGYRSNNSA